MRKNGKTTIQLDYDYEKLQLNRTVLLNYLVEQHGLKRYLEIGVQDPKQNFDMISCEYKISVDPDPNAGATFKCTSDFFFQYHSHEFSLLDVTSKDSGGEYKTLDQRFDLIFIDGLHTAEQVKKDFENALKILSPNGFIVLHDCSPAKEEHTIVPRPTPTGHWNGDVWRFAIAMFGFQDIERCTVDIDNGCMVFKNSDDWTIVNFGISQMPWSEFNNKRTKYLNLITWDEFINLNPHVS